MTSDDKTTPIGSVTKVGNIGKMNEIRFSKAGTAWIEFSLAVTPYDPKAPKDQQRETKWYTVKCFRDLAEGVAECLGVGTRVIVTGTGEKREYTTKDGREGTELSILADAVGADLRWARYEVNKVSRTSPVQEKMDPDDDF